MPEQSLHTTSPIAPPWLELTYFSFGPTRRSKFFRFRYALIGK